MKLFYVLLITMFAGCINEKPPARWAKDDLWCWHQDDNGRWQPRGLSQECPDGTRYDNKPWAK